MFKYDLEDGVELRMLRLQHAAEFLEMVAENRDYFGEWLGWANAINTATDAEDFLRRGVSRFAEDGIPWIGIWQDGRMVGGILIFPLEHRIRATKIGYWLAQSATGRGLMTRAIEAILPFVFEELNINRLGLEAEPGNLKSKGVAERLGFTFEGLRRQGWYNNEKFVDIAVYSLLAQEWQARQDH